ncbi:MAG: hypothetical protein IBX55_09945 [Methyloprofundus sp.]|nr:hypothetical protein [Methyloprofundus sp.]
MLVTVNHVKDFMAQAVESRKKADDMGFRLNWFFQGYMFEARFLRSEPIMHVGLMDGSDELESIELPYDPKTHMNRLVQDLKLHKVSEVLVHEAARFGRIDGYLVG